MPFCIFLCIVQKVFRSVLIEPNFTVDFTAQPLRAQAFGTRSGFLAPFFSYQSIETINYDHISPKHLT